MWSEQIALWALRAGNFENLRICHQQSPAQRNPTSFMRKSYMQGAAANATTGISPWPPRLKLDDHSSELDLARQHSITRVGMATATVPKCYMGSTTMAQLLSSPLEKKRCTMNSTVFTRL